MILTTISTVWASEDSFCHSLPVLTALAAALNPTLGFFLAGPAAILPCQPHNVSTQHCTCWYCPLCRHLLQSTPVELGLVWSRLVQSSPADISLVQSSAKSHTERSGTLDIKEWTPWKYNDNMCVQCERAVQTRTHFVIYKSYQIDI